MASTDDYLTQYVFVFHIGFALISGAIAMLYPSFWHVFFTLDEKGNQRELLNTAIQLYGSLIIGQAILVYTLRDHISTLRTKSSPSSHSLRQGICLAYTVVFTLSFCFVVKAHMVGVMNVAAHVNSLLFVGLAGAYAMLYVRGMNATTKHSGL